MSRFVCLSMLFSMLCLHRVSGQFFSRSALLRTGRLPTFAATCDFSGDGVADIVTTNFQGNTLTILINNRFAGSVPAFTTSTLAGANGPYGVACADLNLDGKFDLVWTNDGVENNWDRTMSYVINQGVNPQQPNTIVWSPVTTFVVGENPSDVVAGDLNNDGAVDLAVTVTNERRIVIFYNQIRTNGTLFFTTQNFTVGKEPYQIGIADFNKDGFPDLVVTNTGDSTISIFRNSNNGFLVNSQVQFQAGEFPLGLTEADVNQDGFTDIIVTSSYVVTVILNTQTQVSSELSFSSTLIFLQAGDHPVELVSADFNNDGLIDLACTNWLSGTFSVFSNIGSPGVFRFNSSVSYRSGNRPWGIAVGSFLSNNRSDIVTTNQFDNVVAVFTNLATVQPTVAPFVPSALSAGAVFGIVIGISIGALLLMIGIIGLINLYFKQKNAGAPPPQETLPGGTSPSGPQQVPMQNVASGATAPTVSDFD